MAGKLIFLALTFFIARYLGDAEFGKFSFAITFSSLFLIFSDLGLTMLATREIAKDKSLAARYLGSIILVKLFLSLLAWALTAWLVNLAGYPADTRNAVYVLMAALIINSFVEAFGAVFRAYEKMEYVSILMIVQKFVCSAGGIAALVLGMKLDSVVYAYLAGSVVSGLAGYLILRKKFVKPLIKFEPGFLKELIRKALPVGVSIFFSGIYFRVDIVLLSLIKGDAVTGWYSAAYKPMEALMVLPAGFVGALFPVFSRLFKTSREALLFTCEKAIKVLFIFILPVAAGTAILADKLIPLFYGSRFEASVSALRILIWAAVFIFINFVLTQLLIAIEKQKFNAVFTIICAVFNLSLNLIFIPIAGYLAAAVITVATEVLLFWMCFAVVLSKLGTVRMDRIIMKPAVTCAAMCAVLLMLRQQPLFVSVPVAAAVYLAALKLVKVLDGDDLSIIKSLFRGEAAGQADEKVS